MDTTASRCEAVFAFEALDLGSSVVRHLNRSDAGTQKQRSANAAAAQGACRSGTRNHNLFRNWSMQMP